MNAFIFYIQKVMDLSHLDWNININIEWRRKERKKLWAARADVTNFGGNLQSYAGPQPVRPLDNSQTCSHHDTFLNRGSEFLIHAYG
jgi:hypothetical protein